jgi:hypothetical protein
MVVRRAVAITFALVGLAGLAGAFIAGTGSAAVATDGQAVLAGQGNTETGTTGLTNGNFGVAFVATTYTGNPSSAIWGQAVSGTGSGNGVIGESEGNTSSGVYGQNDNAGYGVAGRAANGTGVLADSANGTALNVSGVLVASRSGLATVATGQIYKQVSLTKLSATTFIVATVQGATAGVWVQRVVVNPSGGYFRIYLDKAATANTKVGWFAIN